MSFRETGFLEISAHPAAPICRLPPLAPPRLAPPSVGLALVPTRPHYGGMNESGDQRPHDQAERTPDPRRVYPPPSHTRRALASSLWARTLASSLQRRTGTASGADSWSSRSRRTVALKGAVSRSNVPPRASRECDLPTPPEALLRLPGAPECALDRRSRRLPRLGGKDPRGELVECPSLAGGECIIELLSPTEATYRGPRQAIPGSPTRDLHTRGPTPHLKPHKHAEEPAKVAYDGLQPATRVPSKFYRGSRQALSKNYLQKEVFFAFVVVPLYCYV